MRPGDVATVPVYDSVLVRGVPLTVLVTAVVPIIVVTGLSLVIVAVEAACG